MMIICMDANFRLKNQIVSNYSQDPGLGIGMAYMVPRKPYEEYVLSRASDNDVGPLAFELQRLTDVALPDQHMRWFSSTCESEHKVFGRPTLHRGECSSVWTVGDGVASWCG